MANNTGNDAGDRDGAEGASGAQRLSAPPDDARTPRLPFPVVGIGASAGGLEAYTEFLQATPVDAGMAYVLVQHLPPDRESLVVELLARQTRMPVVQVVDGQVVEPDHVYVIRPGHTLTIEDGHLRLGPELAARGHGRPVDDFFRSLAEEQQQRAVAVVFSGMGSNGSAGAQAVKAVGGLVIAQEPDTAKYPSMPRSLIDCQLADLILRPAEVPEALAKYAGQAYVAVDGGGAATPRDEQALTDVLSVLRTRTRHDFSGYRKPTLFRRVRRRMSLCQIASLPEYVRALRQTPAEVAALADDLLIHVTGFFRDPEVWVVLRDKVIDPLVLDRADGADIRCWVSACATGEEAYTLAMLVVEAAEARGKRFDVKVFATDMAERALGLARAGVFPNGIESEVTPERLARFFDKDDSFYRVKKELRELVMFAPQNILQDPPFSRLDIATCRNLLIYLEPDTQRRVLAVLHFGLREGGALLLGSSESAAPTDGDFEPIDKRHRLFRRIGPTRSGTLDMPVLTAAIREVRPTAVATHGRLTAPAIAQLASRALLDRYTPPAVVVDAAGQVVHVHGDTARYLTLAPGGPTLDLMSLANDQVRGAARTALRQAIDTQAAVVIRDGCIDTLEGRRRVEVGAAPLGPRGGSPLFLVTFHDHPDPPAPTARPHDDRAAAGPLADELQRARHELQGVLEQMQSSNEELKASHEEATSLNEELQSTNEELETSKEEMQSLNEELVTVNAQLQTKMIELEGTANDLGSLLTSTDIAVLFLDPGFRIRRFTPAVKDLLDLIPPDVGRPFLHMRRKFADPQLMVDAQAVLDRLIPIERAIESESGRAYLRRILPYRTRDNRIDGVVVAFVDVTERKRADAALAASAARDGFRVALADALRPLADPHEVQAAAARVLGQHLRASRVLYAETVAEQTLEHVVHGDYRVGVPSVVGVHHLDDFGRFVVESFRAGRTVVRRSLDDPALPALPADDRATYEAITVAAHVCVPLVKAGKLVAFLAVQQSTPRGWTAEEVALVEETAERTWAAVERARAEAALRASEEKYRALFDSMDEAYAVVEMVADAAGDWTDFLFLEVNPAFTRQTGAGDPVGRTATQMLGGVNPRWAEVYGRVARTGEPVRFQDREEALGRLFDLYVFRLGGPGSRRVAVLFTDITARKRAEEVLRDSEARLRTVAANLPNGAAFVVDGDLRYTLAEGQALVAAGFTSADFEGKTLAEALPTDLARQHAPYYRQALAGAPFRVEHAAYGRQFVTHGEPLRGPTGQVTAVLAVSYDITHLRLAEQRLRLALAAARMGIWTLNADADAHMRDANLNRLLGLEPIETTQPFAAFLARIHPDDRALVSTAFAESLRDRQPLSVEFRIVRPDGEVRWLRDQGDVFGDVAAGRRHMAGACVDVTERRAAEDAVRAGEERLRLILASATDYAILTLADDRTVTSWSSGAAATFGYDEAEILGRPADVLFTPEDRAAGVPDIESDTARRVGRADDERWHLRTDGTRFYASGVLTRLATGGFVKVARDLTDRKRMEDQLRDARDQLEERVVERTAELAAAVSSLEAEIARRRELTLRLSNAQEDERKRVSRDLHDTVGQTHMALTIALAAAVQSAPPDGEVASHLTHAGQLAEDMSRELHDVAVRLRPTTLDDLGLAAALDGLVHTWSRQQSAQIELQADLDERLPIEVETALYRLVQEALTNVARHARAGMVSVIVTRQPGLVTAVVEDDGEGFDPESVGASRLGLRGMRERVALIGGELIVESQPGAGTSIIARVPL